MAVVPHVLLQADTDLQETQEWLESLDAVVAKEGPERARYLVERLVEEMRDAGVVVPHNGNTLYRNTITTADQPPYPGDPEIELRIQAYLRWNAMAMVVRANKHTNVGGHIASYASSATLYDVGFNWFWKAPTENQEGDLIFFQGHSIPGIYARAYLLGRLTEEQLDGFRQETNGKGLSSYPHPWLMPDFWQFPTVSMGLGPLQAIYQARFMKYLQDRGIQNNEGRKVWAFLGDGEMDEVESRGAISLASREKLDNLIFVINCNLQRLDGPVRGNGSVIQELEAEFRGAGWNVIKLLWGSNWDALFARDTKGLLKKRMLEVVDGEYQTYKSKNGAWVREHFFNTPELKELVADWSDEDIWKLNRGGHDLTKVFAAYKAAVETKGQPTLILAKTVKGFGMGESGEAQNTSHQQKKMSLDALRAFRDRFHIPVSDEDLEKMPLIKFEEGSPELNYMRERRAALGGYLPARRRKAAALAVPALSAFDAQLKASGEGREFSSTMALVRIFNTILKDKQIGKHVVPIVVDESRTFGMEGMFRQYGIWNQEGQKYIPQDHDQLMFYKESKDGQVLQDGINEAGAMADWIAAATAYSAHGVPMIPFYIFYSMFGPQRTMDLCWAAGDSRARGFLIGGTAGRTTLNGEGLQHEDGHSHALTHTIPNCVSYDPTFAYEVAVIFQDGLRRMYAEQEDVYYYITVMNENYEHPAMPEGAEADIIKGLYKFREGAKSKGPRVQLLGSGTIFREVIAAAELLKADWGVEADIWGAPSFNELARDGQDAARWNMLHPLETQRLSHVAAKLKGAQGPVIAATDYIRLYAEQIRPYVANRYVVLGTDGFGRSDTREALRAHFEVDRHWVTVAALSALAEDGKIERAKVAEAIAKYGIDVNKPNPLFA
ncbi:MAG: pyruvate dehydrogenase (acetyl-transferring), homodimeric type [Candidatus Dactylopiibacterium carminicum]|uniref:Pyruvate dehydrogenase E1 component n=1 Tax=Candidatus Dactylopiibacterium carminicum TaxID=857335 RepID=A0A272ES60_9RHOO|nr:pyruvate dehydrogenase (acetyl-transferring), homodimeric type [Candidatus Dactylopiibacterium carminicum]KAF7598991.1 pyruvate dehydrogenase (acetyl-transferring), homodimeric type [Candidatus Dactylopiibacterium carminicum]PAS92941.1 MAG: pyruvate dehydrogenase (acetyl-transferring), homodimeric type [Candidatus Dactylopiibacterium carminicum]PAS96592.1 MAG: pyruvate dehydrogenase (acetyl-transferring), homodimeric type [Candidatus Dactylopiibacterium carminicum]PAS99003.1 MAG: pyruvate de